MRVEASRIDQYSNPFGFKFFFGLLVCIPSIAVQGMLIVSVGLGGYEDGIPGAIEFLESIPVSLFTLCVIVVGNVWFASQYTPLGGRLGGFLAYGIIGSLTTFLIAWIFLII